MDAATELVELLDLSGDVRQAVVLDGSSVIATTVDADRSNAFEEAVRDVVAVAERVKPGQPAALSRFGATVDDGGLFVVRGERFTVAATTVPSPSAALVVHDLLAVLRRLEGGNA